MTPEGWAAVISIVGFVGLLLRQIFSTEFKLKNMTDKSAEGSLPALSAKIQALEDQRLKDAKDALEALKAERTLPITATPLGQKVHDMANGMTAHYLHDDSRFDEIKQDMKTGFETLRKEQVEQTATILKALAGNAGRAKR